MDTQSDNVTQETEKADISIIVNGRSKPLSEKRITFEELVKLAFPDHYGTAGYEYTVTYAKGPNGQEEGTLTAGHSVKVKDGMVFNVSETTQS